MRRQELLQAAVTAWGVEAQVMMAVEEMAELTQALSKAYRGKEGAVYNLLEEVADVRIMLDQLVLIFEPMANVKATFATRLAEDAKLTRLAFRLGTTYEPEVTP